MDAWVEPHAKSSRKLGSTPSSSNNRRIRRRTESDTLTSRFVVCPGCERTIPHHRLDEHMDRECNSRPNVENASESSPHPEVVPLAQRMPRPRTSGLQISKYSRQTHTTISIPLSQFCEEVPCDLLTNFLDPAMADQLLSTLLSESKTWRSHTWWLFDKAHETPRRTAMYPIRTEHLFSGDTAAESKTLDIGSAELLDSHIDLLPEIGQQVETTVNLRRKQRPSPEKDPSLRYRIANNNNNNSSSVDNDGSHTMEASDVGWEATYALCNMYRDHNDCVGAHADRLTSLGPLPTIAALSLGAARKFKFNRTGTERGDGNSYSIVLPHNSLLIMWPPAQEQWTHEVPRMSAGSVQPHAISGLARISLTFRQFKSDYYEGTPLCKCNHRCILKASTRSGDNYQRYYYACDTSKESKPCHYFQWADWCVLKEASNTA